MQSSNGMENIAADSIGARLEDIQKRIDSAARRAGRDPDDVRLVAVSKSFPPETVDEAIRAGVSILGENRVQEALAKSQMCSAAEWHLIGRLQRNKIRHALSLFSTIHSIDTIPLLADLARIQEETGQRPKIMLEVNVAGESSKIGFTPKTVRDAVRETMALGNLNLVGLMTIPPWVPEPEMSRRHFAALRELRDALSEEFGIGLPELSMGMSADFEVAVEEGATYVRVGTALFGKRSSWKPVRSLDTDDFV